MGPLAHSDRQCAHQAGEKGGCHMPGPLKTLTRCAGGALLLVVLLGSSSPTSAESARWVEEVVLRAKPAVVLVATRVDADVTLDCGAGPIRLSPPPYPIGSVCIKRPSRG